MTQRCNNFNRVPLSKINLSLSYTIYKYEFLGVFIFTQQLPNDGIGFMHGKGTLHDGINLKIM